MGWKGRVHLHFGEPITDIPETPQALASIIDHQIILGQRVFDTGRLADALLNQSSLPDDLLPDVQDRFQSLISGTPENTAPSYWRFTRTAKAVHPSSTERALRRSLTGVFRQMLLRCALAVSSVTRISGAIRLFVNSSTIHRATSCSRGKSSRHKEPTTASRSMVICSTIISNTERGTKMVPNKMSIRWFSDYQSRCSANIHDILL